MTQSQIDKATKLLGHRLGEYRKIGCVMVEILEGEKAAKELEDALAEAHAKYEPKTRGLAKSITHPYSASKETK